MSISTGEKDNQAFSKAFMPNKIFKQLSDFIYDEVGIKLPPAKKTMLEARIRKRLRALGMGSFEDYCKYIFSPNGMDKELIHMIDVVTTNKTDFFREPRHFEYLVQNALPELIKKEKAYKRYRFWSAGCSTGEEPYTLAIVLKEFEEKYGSFSFSILATDICTEVLQKAIKGVYEMNRVEAIPITLKKKYLLRNKDPRKKLARINPDLRKHIEFRRLNLMSGDFNIKEPLDIIFCRNVIIYFDRPTQERLLNHFHRLLRPGGYIFMGHSETLHGLNVPLVQVSPTVYRRLK